MGRVIIQHIDDAPYLYGEKLVPGQPLTDTGQIIGDMAKGPWIHVHSMGPNAVASPHSHDQDEVILVMEGEIRMGKRVCGPGSVVFFEKDTQYGFSVGPEGVRYVNVRPGLARFKPAGAPDYIEFFKPEMAD